MPASPSDSAALDSLGDLRRTHYCGDLREGDIGTDAVLMGWVHRKRDLGGLLFLHLRDRSGISQVVFNAETHPEAHAKAETLRGRVRDRRRRARSSAAPKTPTTPTSQRARLSLWPGTCSS